MLKPSQLIDVHAMFLYEVCDERLKHMNLSVPKMKAKIYEPANRCIYCGADRYAHDSKRNLAEEHIIPFGLNGELVLPRASCRRCERITGRDDSIFLRGALLGCRTILNLKTRSPKERPKNLPLFDQNNRKIMVDIEDYPAMIMLIGFGDPSIISGSGTGVATSYSVTPLALDNGALIRKYGITQYSPAMLDTHAFSRVLAKIAHSYVEAERAYAGFHRILPRRIVEKDDPMLDCVGTVQYSVPKPDALHEIYLENFDINSTHLVCRIQLFAFLNLPCYRVVVATRA